MDNPLTPKKIQRLMYFAAEDKSFNHAKSGHFVNASAQPSSIASVPEPVHPSESSSGILDLEQCEGFGDSGLANLSLSKSTSFHPAEMTGRSTGAAEQVAKMLTTFTDYGRHSVMECKNIEKVMNLQTNDVDEIMSQSIVPGYSFQSKLQLTADEESLLNRELPVHPKLINMDLKETTIMSQPSEMSMGSYFTKRCDRIDEILKQTDSPKRDISSMSLGLDISHDPAVQIRELQKQEPSSHYTLDTSLDSVPVRQPKTIRSTKTEAPRDARSVKTEAPRDPGIVKPEAPRDRRSVKPEASRDRPKNSVACSVLMDPSKQHLLPTAGPGKTEESTAISEEESINISHIRGFLEKESSIDMEMLIRYMRMNDKVLNPMDANSEAYRRRSNVPDLPVTSLKDTKKTETASSAGTINTVIDTGKKKQNQENIEKKIPAVIVTRSSLAKSENVDIEMDKRESVKTDNRSKSPSSKSRSTLSTVQENLALNSPKLSDSYSRNSKGEGKSSHIPSPNIQYKELDKSVDWQELLQPRGRLKSEGSASASAKDWADVLALPVDGFVGVSIPTTLEVTSLSDSWLTATITPNPSKHSRDINIDLPRFPILLPPGKEEKLTLHVTSNVEVTTELTFTLVLKDTSLDEEQHKVFTVDVATRMPSIQAVSADRMNSVTFPPIQEGKSCVRSLVLISDCPSDLLLDLSVLESKAFTISSVQEIQKSDVSKQLVDNGQEDPRKRMNKGSTKQLCKLTDGNAIKVTLKFTAPTLSELNLANKPAQLKGSLTVSLIGVNALLKRVELAGAVGHARLALDTVMKKIHINGNEVVSLPVRNEGSVTGAWTVHVKDDNQQDTNMFRVSYNKFELGSGATLHFKVTYHGPEDKLCKGFLVFKHADGSRTSIELSGGSDKPKTFPIKTNKAELCFIRNGRKELSLKNFTDQTQKVAIKIVGEGFYLDIIRDAPQSVTSILTFGPGECRTIPVVFQANHGRPCAAKMIMTLEKEKSLGKKIPLYGTAGGVAPLRWSGSLVTYGDTALVRALTRHPLALAVDNKSSTPAFLAATVHFNLQYRSVAPYSKLIKSHRVIPAKTSATLTLEVEWARVEKLARAAGRAAATALCCVTLLTGAELTRRRILKILSASGDSARSLPDHLQQLTQPFDGEQPEMDQLLEHFHETKLSLDELVGGIHELTAQIDLPQDFPEDNTIIIVDDTAKDHHTLADIA
ncbi:hypothetical protein JYU34_001632 [Plutella xylostella]|uniref:Cep192/Spd-2-like domain-containing protein n=1 Tax=Plutella xylostella TaxID=51655 RepID=A0ABQ7R4E2_PLUXY|nr:hypothetical protein JYU34_001632 [Plutella xylostella]